jgi:alkylation response protein AidB-like acyl-CoA dehydrogenase
MSFDPISSALSALNRFSQKPWVHKLGLYEPAQKLAHGATREGFRAATTLGRRFKDVQKLVKPARVPAPDNKSDLFDLSISEEQQMMRDMVQRFAREVMRPSAAAANDAGAVPEGFHAQLAELGLAQFAVPEQLGGAADTASPVTQALIAEDLAHGDMGLAVAALAPIGVAHALARWGSAAQQSRYLSAFAEDTPPLATLALCERRPAFDPLTLRTRARAEGDGYVLDGEKTLVPLAERAELLLVAAAVEGRGVGIFVLEPDTPGLTRRAEPAMGLKAAELGVVELKDVRLPASALLGGELGACDYAELVDRARLGFCAAAVGTAQAVLDYVIPYVNDRKAFGEPISHRQSVAFLAHVMCVERGMEIGTNGVQLLGGHGYTKEHPVERWYRDLMSIGVMEGALQV